MDQLPDFTIKTDDSGAVELALAGPLVVARIAALDKALRALAGPVARLDLAGVTAIDTVGAWLCWRTADALGAEITHADEDSRRLINAVRGDQEELPPPPPPQPAWRETLARLGQLVVDGATGAVDVLAFMGALLEAAWGIARHPGRLRGTALARQLQLVGIDALGIVGLMSFLIGIVIAQQGAVQLQQFGAQIYTINLTGRLAFRELGCLMTAIMVAGRSGSSFAAQLGTMKLTEEIDAMRTIGVSPLEALVLPRVLAAVWMLPLLGFYSALIAIVGGASISAVVLDIPFVTFLLRIQEVVPIRDLWVGLIKAPVFGFIIAITGCYQGLRVSGNSEEVGLRTTMAVVQAIFMVIVLDAFFAVFFSGVGWG
ncbi:MAG TPA: ABC transporter permease [Novosphingobium sp.]|nr:ABC transporter permease [Novosphingobium sp.]HZV08353.1 ABC transporter permease [Novosphingobium sp.]